LSVRATNTKQRTVIDWKENREGDCRFVGRGGN
jgi:hypothetical protein